MRAIMVGLNLHWVCPSRWNRRRPGCPNCQKAVNGATRDREIGDEILIGAGHVDIVMIAPNDFNPSSVLCGHQRMPNPSSALMTLTFLIQQFMQFSG